jgi:hypothetical protein
MLLWAPSAEQICDNYYAGDNNKKNSCNDNVFGWCKRHSGAPFILIHERSETLNFRAGV